MKVKTGTYKFFLDSIKSASTSKLSKKSGTIIEHFRPAKENISRFAPATFLLDYSTKKYLYVEETCFNVLGYSAEWFLETGLEEYLSKWHPADFNVINNKIFQDNLSFLQKLCLEEYSDYIFSYNYRFRNPKGEYITVLQRFSYVPHSFTTQPAGIVGVTFDISHYKNDTSIVHTIEKVITTADGIINELMYKKIHPVYEEGNRKLFSSREIETLQFLAKGLSSKQIASELHLSINTVNNHRRNMLNKMECKSSSELVNYAAKHGLL